MMDTKEVQCFKWCDEVVENWTNFNNLTKCSLLLHCELFRYLLLCDFIVLYDLDACYTVLTKIPLCSSRESPFPMWHRLLQNTLKNVPITAIRSTITRLPSGSC